MNTKNATITAIIAIIIVAIAWFSLDHRSKYPQSPEDIKASLASSTAPVATTTTTATTPAASNSTPTTSINTPVKNLMHTITIETSKGTIVLETYDADAPKTVANFISLANKGFYNGLIFHRVIEGFMIQGGDPTGTGTGGPGYQFADELNPATDSYKAGYVRGTLAMANSGPNTNGSQFFIMQANNQLQHNYSIFGKVISGMDVVDAIAATKVDASDKPLVPITMNKVTVADVK